VSGLRDCGGWIQALSLQARGHLEEAEDMYAELLKDTTHPEAALFIVRNGAMCCAELGRWSEWDKWRLRYQQLQKKEGATEPVFASKLVVALSKFDQGDIAGAEQVLR
jgi:hypothetical protein